MNSLVLCKIVVLAPSLKHLEAGGVILSMDEIKFVLGEATNLKAFCVLYALVKDDDIYENIELFRDLSELCLHKTDVTHLGVEYLKKHVCIDVEI